jgi:MFS family permease
MDSHLRRVSRTYAQAFEGLPKEVWLLSWVMLINRSGSMVLTFAALYVHQELGYSDRLAAFIVIAWGLGSSLGTFVGGYLTDRFGPIRVQVFSLIGSGIGYALLSQMTSYWAFAIMLGTVSAIADVFRPANGMALTAFTTPELHGKAFALNRLAINLGLTVGPALGGFLATYSYQWVFWIDAATSLVAGVMMYVWLRHSNLNQMKGEKRSDSEPRVSPWTDFSFLQFLFLNFVTYTIFFQILSTYPLFLKIEYLMSEMKIGFLLAFNTIIVVAVEMVLVHKLRHLPRLPLIAWGSFLMIEGFGMLSVGHGIAFAYLSVLVWTIGEMLAMPHGLAYVASYGPPAARARYLAAYSTCIALAFVSAPLIGALCYSVNHYLMWQISLPLGILVLVGTYSLKRDRDQRIPLN